MSGRRGKGGRWREYGWCGLVTLAVLAAGLVAVAVQGVDKYGKSYG